MVPRAACERPSLQGRPNFASAGSQQMLQMLSLIHIFSPATDEMRRIYACECASLHEVRRKLEDGEL